MASIMKTTIRFVVIAGLATGAAALIAGPHRVAALASEARTKVVSVIDSNIDDPTVLRAQLRDMASKYPDKIASVRGDLAELREQMRQIERDKQIGERVVSLAAADLEVLEPMLARAKVARATASPGQAVLVSFSDAQLPLEDALKRATQIHNTRAAYLNRVADAQTTIAFMAEQEAQLSELVETLEVEHAEFQAQLWQLDHQVDAIARNDRIIEIVEERQKQIDRHGRFDVQSLDQWKQRVAQLQAEQRARFEQLKSAAARESYEDKAIQQLNSERAAESEYDKAKEWSQQGAPLAPVHISPESDAAPEAGSMAFNAPVVIN